MVGWGSSFYQGAANAQQFDSVSRAGRAQVVHHAQPGARSLGAATLTLSSVAIGYTRDFTNSYLGDFYRATAGTSTCRTSSAVSFLLVANAGVAAVEYPTVFPIADTSAPFSSRPSRRSAPTAILFGEYRVADSVGINSTMRYTANVTDQYNVCGRRSAVEAFEAFVGVRWFL